MQAARTNACSATKKPSAGQQVASADAVRQQIDRYLQWVRPDAANEAAFYGGSFTGLPADLQTELFQPVDKLLADGVIGSVRLSTRPDYIDAERLALLKRLGVKTVELGVQSLDDKVLAAAERGHQASAVYDAVALLKQFGFSVGLQLMVGMPGQSFAQPARYHRPGHKPQAKPGTHLPAGWSSKARLWPPLMPAEPLRR